MSEGETNSGPVICDGELLDRMACQATCEGSFVKGLNNASLAELVSHHGRKASATGIPGRVHAFALYEAAQRFVKGVMR